MTTIPEGGSAATGARITRAGFLFAAGTFVAGVATGRFLRLGGRDAGRRSAEIDALFEPRKLPVRYGQLGPKLIEAGAIDFDRFASALDGQGKSLTDAQRRLLRDGGDDFVRIDRADALFLLDFFWAVGLSNRNPILNDGPMGRLGRDRIGGFASTGGWTLGARPATELYAGTPLVTLTGEAQERLARVAQQLYRPCCDNPTYFPDCNHGMAMLGLLSVLASGGADEDELFQSAAAANAVWYPQQYREVGIYLAAQERKLDRVEARELVSPELASGSGYRAVHGALEARGPLETTPAGGASAC